MYMPYYSYLIAVVEREHKRTTLMYAILPLLLPQKTVSKTMSGNNRVSLYSRTLRSKEIHRQLRCNATNIGAFHPVLALHMRADSH